MNHKYSYNYEKSYYFNCSTLSSYKFQPNPSQGVFSVQVNGAEGDGMIRITKSGGQIVYSQVYTGQALNISGFTKGEYTVYYIENQVVKANAGLIVE